MDPSQKKYTILITDDERMNVEVLAGILAPAYNLLIARNGARALELAASQRPDLILLDVIMPDMSGFEVIRALKGSEETAGIPVIFITGLTSAADEEKGFFLGAVDYIAKPFNKSIVNARVNTQMKIVDQMRTIEQIGLMDPLTKIPNRRGFENRLNAEWGRAVREKAPIAILVMDIDKFKVYNDTYGHQQGDAALKAFAAAVAGSLMRPVDFAARWGGEEFVVLLPGADAGGAAEVAERVRRNVEAVIIPAENDAVTQITASIGVNAAYPGVGDSMEIFIKKADQALYKAKNEGRNRCAVYGDGEDAHV